MRLLVQTSASCPPCVHDGVDMEEVLALLFSHCPAHIPSSAHGKPAREGTGCRDSHVRAASGAFDTHISMSVPKYPLNTVLPLLHQHVSAQCAHPYMIVDPSLVSVVLSACAVRIQHTYTHTHVYMHTYTRPYLAFFAKPCSCQVRRPSTLPRPAPVVLRVAASSLLVSRALPLPLASRGRDG